MFAARESIFVSTILGAAVVIISVSAPIPAGAGQTPAPCSTPEYRQFDFWIGDWVVYTPAGQIAGTNKIEQVSGRLCSPRKLDLSVGSLRSQLQLLRRRERDLAPFSQSLRPPTTTMM